MKNPLATHEMVRRKARRRRWWRRTRRTLLAIAAVAVAGGLAYGGDRLAVEGHHLYVEYVEHGHGVASVTAPTSAPTTTTTVPGPPACASQQLNAYLAHWQIAGATLYEVIVLATGSAPFVPPVPGVEKKGVFVYRTIEDLEQIIAADGAGVETLLAEGNGLLVAVAEAFGEFQVRLGEQGRNV